ncbi:MAG: hypothetical protein VB858_18400 [Planctomycetaceae bacterium]
MTQWFQVALVVTAFATSGCQLGRFSLALNQEHQVPYPTLHLLPEQWEPTLAEPTLAEPKLAEQE